jgi:L-histidine N-alpha-methyltransferase
VGEDALEEIRSGLAQPQKQLPSKFFYDRYGSELFERITRLPEYYPTRAETALLAQEMPGWIASFEPRALVELGAGNAEKTRIILDAMREVGSAECYLPVDISAEFLESTAVALRAEYPGLEVRPIAADFTRRIELGAELPRPALITILGSTIGNFPEADAVALVRRVRAAMRAEDRFLLGVDLRKEVSVLEAAYNDREGVTAEFNLNALRVLNREYGADFDLSRFQHVAHYNAAEHRIEMHLAALRPQEVHIPGVGTITLRSGETIRTEISCKYDHASVRTMFSAAGLKLGEWFTDGAFALAVGTVT